MRHFYRKGDVYYTPGAVLSIVDEDEEEIFFEVDWDILRIEHLTVPEFQALLTKHNFRKDENG